MVFKSNIKIANILQEDICNTKGLNLNLSKWVANQDTVIQLYHSLMSNLQEYSLKI